MLSSRLLKIMGETTITGTISFLENIFARHGIPVSITSDNGPQFMPLEWKAFCQRYRIAAYYTSIPYWARANGEVERQNRCVQKLLQISKLLQGSCLEKKLFDYLLMYHATPYSVNGKSPTELIFGRKIRDKLPSLQERMEVAKVREQDAYNEAKSLTLTSAVPEKEIAVGDEVLIQRPSTKAKSEDKF